MRVSSAALGFTALSLTAITLATPASAHFNPRAAYAHRVQAARAVHHSRLQCVPFARTESGVEITGNAATWWDQAAGVYDRGHTPEPGSVLAFQGSERIPLGHVAVVGTVISAREIEIDHANWGGGIHRNVAVVDVSPRNDWSQVRVEMGQTGDFGATYPVHGFIYDRPAGTRPATLSAAASGPAPSAARLTNRITPSGDLIIGGNAASAQAAPPLEANARDPMTADPMEAGGTRDPFESFHTPFRTFTRGSVRTLAHHHEVEEVAELPTKRHRHHR